MSELAILDQKLPAHLRSLDTLDETTKALMGSTGGTNKRISIEGGVWRMLVNGNEVARNEERSMNVVIVAAAPKVSRTFYAGVYKRVLLLHLTAGLLMVISLTLQQSFPSRRCVLAVLRT